MAESKTLVSSSSSEQVRLLHLNLPTLTDENIKSQVQQTHSSGYSPLLRQPLLVRISHIIKPATHFVDSILLDKNAIKKGIELESSNLLEFNSALSELKTWRGSLTKITNLMGNATDRDEVMFDQIIDQMPIYLLHAVSESSWDKKALFIMEDLVIKFVKLLKFLLIGLNKSSINLASSMAALKENPVSIAGTPIEKFQQPLDQLSSMIKITLELIQYICELTLLSDTEYRKEDIVSMGVYWAIISAVAGYIQITLIVDNGLTLRSYRKKTILLLISDLNISTEDTSTLLKIYEEIKTENYYKIVWIPFVLKWTQELRKKFENLKSKMPWYTVCYDSPIAGLWYFKGHWIHKKPSIVLINHLGKVETQASLDRVVIYTKFSSNSKRIMIG